MFDLNAFLIVKLGRNFRRNKALKFFLVAKTNICKKDPLKKISYASNAVKMKNLQILINKNRVGKN